MIGSQCSSVGSINESQKLCLLIFVFESVSWTSTVNMDTLPLCITQIQTGLPTSQTSHRLMALQTNYLT
jgi:hypothetical protein